MEKTDKPTGSVRFIKHGITGAAEDYYFAGDLCINEFKKTYDSHYILPAFVNYALSGELYLKAIYILENNKKSKNIHSYALLIAQLSLQMQKLIEELYNSYSPTESFSVAIARYGDVFSRWRYRYETMNADAIFDDFIALITAIRTACEQKDEQIVSNIKELEGMV